MNYSETESPTDPAAAKKRRMLAFTIGALVVSAALVAFLPLKLPTPLRVAVVGIDLIAAAVVFVAYRQSSRS